MHQCKIGTYEQESDSAIVSDPCYEYKVEEHNNPLMMTLNLVIPNVKKGTWGIILRARSDQHARNAELLGIHTSFDDKALWEKIGDIGVDSGQCGIYDIKYYRDNKNTIGDIKWYDMNSAITRAPNNYAGAIPNGAVSSSGFGDGIYDVYVIKSPDLQIVGIKVIFIDDAQIKLWNKVLAKEL